MTLFDCHVHVGSSDSGELYYPHLQLAEYERLMKAAGVERALVFPPYRTGGYAAANRQLAEAAAMTGGRVRALARAGGRTIPLTEPQLWLMRRKLRRLIVPPAPDVEIGELQRFAGVKLLPHLDGVPDRALFDALNALGLPLLTHAGRYVPPSWIRKTILPRVQTRVVLAHLGGFSAGRAELLSAVELAARDPRVYLDTSGVWASDHLRFAAGRVPEKLLFGSDCPLTTPAVAWQMVCSAVTDPGLRRRIGWEAAAEVFGT